MLFTTQKGIFRYIACVLLMLMFFSSCIVVKNHPDKPFIYQNQVVLNGDMSKDEKKRLTAELDNYWDDSLRARWQQEFSLRLSEGELGFIKKLNAPPAFDSANLTRSIHFMNAYLNAQGYYYAGFKDSIRIDTVAKNETRQLRTTVAMYIEAGKNISIDSVSYELNDTAMQRLAIDNKSASVLKKGNPYSKQIINEELDRLVNLYRQNGYYYFTREDIRAIVDSVDASLLTLTLDPFKQAQLIAEAARNRRIDPKWDINIERKPGISPNKLTKYYVGKVYFYPETKLTDIPDSLISQTDFQEFKRRELVMRYKKGTFSYQPLRDHSFFRSGDLYNENTYFKTINTLSQVGAWQQIDGIAVPRDKDSLDIHYFLIPEIKQSYQLSLESSLNTADIGAGNLVGISGSIKYTNRNVWKRAIQSLTTFNSGVELNLLNTSKTDLVQTFFINLGHTYSFPKLILPFKSTRRKLSNIDNKRTLFSLNGSYVDRRDYYQLRSITTSLGYEWKSGNTVWQYRPINVELYSLDRLPLLDTLIKRTPSVRSSFNEGRIISQKLSWIKNFTSPYNFNKTQYLRFDIEEAGGLFGMIPGLKHDIYRYIKLEAEYKEAVLLGKNSELAWRAIAGVGYNYGNDTATLPFFKQFFAGGPNSMRAWQLRQLGLGSSTASDQDLSPNSYRDRFGDMRFEANIEYRFLLSTIAGVKVGSAVFADIGNIWNLKSNPNFPDPAAQFSFKKFYSDLAIGIGTGIRVDFDYFLIRLDFGYKVKDPARPTKDGWMNGFRMSEIRPSGLRINNYAVQLGVNLPF